jgi:hypothetical protein
VEHAVSLTAQKLDRKALRTHCPGLEGEDMRWALEYAAGIIGDRWVPVPVAGYPRGWRRP